MQGDGLALAPGHGAAKRQWAYKKQTICSWLAVTHGRAIWGGQDILSQPLTAATKKPTWMWAFLYDLSAPFTQYWAIFYALKVQSSADSQLINHIVFATIKFPLFFRPCDVQFGVGAVISIKRV